MLPGRRSGIAASGQADNSKQFIAQLAKGAAPDIVVPDGNMPEKDGFETAAWLRTPTPLAGF